MKKFTLLLLLICNLGIAQKQGNIWYFGIQCGLDFSGSSPVAINGATGTDISVWDAQEGTACISDSSGSILFYTGGKTIWNKFHTAMPNGTGIMGGPSSTQSGIIIPQPGNDSLFYVFTSDEFQSYGTPPQKGYRYSVVNMCLDGGNGDVIPAQKNLFLLDSATEKLAACRDLSGNGYWVMGHKMFGNNFYAWHLTASGISSTTVSSIGTLHGWYAPFGTWTFPAAQGQMKFNPQGTKLAVALGNTGPAVLDLFDFNSATGVVSNLCHFVIDSALDKRIYGLEFSPDGLKLYATLSGGSGGKRIYQYDLSSGNCTNIIASRQTIFQSNNNSVLFGMQLGPDNKIYVVCNTYYDVGCINFPNLTGPACGFDSSAVALTGVMNNYTFPSFIAGYKYRNNSVCCYECDTLAPEIPIPNVFSPNGDGINDYVDFSHLNLAEEIVDIYNRWGNKVFESSTSNTKWDGSGCSDGTYYYIFHYSEFINKKIDKKGFIQLVR